MTAVVRVTALPRNSDGCLGGFPPICEGFTAQVGNNSPRRFGEKFEPFLRGFEQHSTRSKLQEKFADISAQNRADVMGMISMQVKGAGSPQPQRTGKARRRTKFQATGKGL